MNKYVLKQIPIYIWIFMIFIFSLSIYIEFFTTLGRSGLFWFLNLFSVSFFMYYMGLFGGIITFSLFFVIRICIEILQPSLLTGKQFILMVLYNILGLILSITIGFLAWKFNSNEKKLRELFNNNDITYWTRDLITGKTVVSEGYVKIYGVSRKEYNQNPNLWYEFVHPDDQTIIEDAIEKQNQGKRTKTVYRINRNDGEVRWVEERGTPIFNKKGQVIRIDGIIIDVTNQKMAEEEINKMAYKDPLTGLPNRNWFLNYVNATILTSKSSKSIAIMFLDFDNFKRVNDTLGHSTGDSLLKQIATRLASCTRKGDIVSRQGGDEFLILIENLNNKEIEEIAERIISAMEDPFIVNGTEIFSTPSIGISMYPESGETAEALIEKADFAMYLAKERGKNNFQFYNDELNQKLKRKMMLEVHLHKAIEQNELSVYYQPQIDLNTGQLVGAEALLRWECDLGKIGPNEFIPIAEETGLIIPIGEWIIREACRHYKQFNQQGLRPFSISVNVSTKQLMNRHFIDRLKGILYEEQVDTHWLTLEITESTLLFYEDAKENIFELRKLGIGISLDDFGVGYSSLSMIKNIEIDELKIDQSFLNDALDNNRVYSLLESIIQIGKKLNAKVVVEGIETPEQLELLLNHGVYGQGYFYSRPLPIENFAKWYYAFYARKR